MTGFGAGRGSDTKGAGARKSRPTQRRKPTRAKALGVSDDDYARLLAAQHGHCALCPNTPKTRRLHVDHDHRTGRIRGLLCMPCNRRLWTGSTTEWLARAALYVYDDPPGSAAAADRSAVIALYEAVY